MAFAITEGADDRSGAVARLFILEPCHVTYLVTFQGVRRKRTAIVVHLLGCSKAGRKSRKSRKGRKIDLKYGGVLPINLWNHLTVWVKPINLWNHEIFG
ncbi:MAG TPA: hypothetical protein DDW76_07225 [Cyanobacteria bacterium UBA11369]|nr:hypothetical protein [Cyanobacteria bacterium UBA11371]HBE31640.1 hypothetical protein [Cyanobacteria bacterium UBA11368]HBE48584.1 hypothetical protein [Cyanobacteria bacterium UBA11369]